MVAWGYILLIVGFLGCAWQASLDPQHIDWAWFGPFAAIGALGVGAVRLGRRAGASADHVLAHQRAELDESLAAIVANLAQLKANKQDIPTHEVRFEIDRRFRDDLRRFAEAREALVHLYGLAAFADVMSAFAAGERYLNRIWSASADGYEDEVLAVIDWAHGQFVDAKATLEAAAAARP